MNYLEIIKNVLTNGTPKQATRYDAAGNVIPVENGTVGTFCEIFRHDMSEGFPLTTLRKMPWRSIRVELEGFIKGVTDKRWFQERGCKFWDEWANPKIVNSKWANSEVDDVDRDSLQAKLNLRKKIQLEENVLGPIYGYQWRSFGQTYDYGQSFDDLCSDNFGLSTGFDQLKSIVDKLKTSPYDRRMVCSAWNPNQEHLMALLPCHYSWSVCVYGNKLNLSWNQRSVDLILGAPSNIASYALLQMLLCEESGLEPGELVGKFEDCHIYDNLMDNARELAERKEKDLPTITIKDKVDGSFSIFDWTWDEVELIGYDPHPKMNMGKVTV